MMTSSAPSWQAEAERLFLTQVQEQYVGRGFTFAIDPSPEELPAFLGSYRPDAVARKGGTSVAIEVSHPVRHSTDWSFAEIQRLFEGHPNWKFVIASMGGDPYVWFNVPKPSLAEVRNKAKEAQGLSDQGLLQPAFVMAWSLLEAAYHRIGKDLGGTQRPLEPSSVLGGVAELGLIEPEREVELCNLIRLRNRVVHGDLGAQPTAADVGLILSAVEEVLVNADALARGEI